MMGIETTQDSQSKLSPTRCKAHLVGETSIVPLILFRIAFGLLMLVSIIRFVANGWVTEFYIEPHFHFTYYGFDWVKPLPGLWMYGVFGLLILLTIGITLGWRYHGCMVGFFVLFTYVELLDKTYYLNHYYFISLLSFLLIFLPLNHTLSLDVQRRPSLESSTVPAWTINAIRLQVGLVYFFAGVAKLKADWLFAAMPLKIWLAANTGFPVIGFLFDHPWLPYLMSWTGALYDLSIPFLLCYRRTRPLAYLAVLGFHLMTAWLFNIGMFPWIMMVCTLIFFDEQDYRAARRLLPHQAKAVVKAVNVFGLRLRQTRASYRPRASQPDAFRVGRPLTLTVLSLFFAWQLLMPWRHWLYPGNVLWTEEGFRFAWNVMLVEKTGYVTFHLHDPTTDRRWTIYPADYLTPQQVKQMSFQPDMILQFAHHLADEFEAQHQTDIAVYAEAYVSLNGRASQLLLDPLVDLTQHQHGWHHKTWLQQQQLP